MSAKVSTVVRPGAAKSAVALSRLLSACCDVIAGYFFRRAALASLRELDDRALRDIASSAARSKGRSTAS